MDIKKIFNVGDVFYYFIRVFKKPEANAPNSSYLRMMHGINRISIIMFLCGFLYWLYKHVL